ncbi:MAG TPA: carboxypeptidase-like regulatory domain-containing protein [Bacteroidota bacterium]|nr:carboxypeptidase-like regulatory domain-containing protein [Bacteroidota bacterium]
MAKRVIYRMLILSVALCCTLSILSAQTGGKISGVVKDAQTGEPLIGANVVIRGTSLGAASDLDGNYFILNIPAGKYEVQASMIGYERVIVQDVIVNSGRTTTLNFDLKQTAIEQEAIVVEATRPDVEPEKTSTSAIVRPEDVQSLAGVRDVGDVIGLAADVTDGHFRGGRTNEELYTLQGMGINNPLDNSSAFLPIVSAVEEIEVITSGFDAQYGNAQSGVVNITMKEGKSDKWRSHFESRMRLPGKKHWGANIFDVKAQPYMMLLADEEFWLGKKNDGKALFKWVNSLFANDTMLTARVGKAVWDQIVAREGDADYTKRIDYAVEGATGGPIDEGVTMFMAFRSNIENPILPTQQPDEQRQVMGNVAFDLGQGAAFKVSGGYQYEFENYFSGGTGFYGWMWDRILGIQYRQRMNHQFGLRYTKALSAKTFYDIKLNGLRTEYRLGTTPWYDTIIPDAINVQTGSGVIFRTGSLFSFDGFTNKTFSYLGNTQGNFSNERTATISLDASFTSQVTNSHMLNGGIQANYYFLRVDNVYNIQSMGGISKTKYTGEPWEAGIYLQDKMEFEGMIAKVGLRWDVWNSNNYYYENFFNPYFVVIDEETGRGIQDPDNAPKTKANPIGRLQPRIGISFPVSVSTVFHLNYGVFLQRPPFQYMIGNRVQVTREGEFPYMIGNSTLKPQSTNSYDVGIIQGLGEGFTVDVSGWYKDVKNLIEVATIVDQMQSNVSFQSYFNRAYADIRGFRVVLSKKRGALTGSLNYQYSVATGKSASPTNAPWVVTRYDDGTSSTDLQKVPVRDVLLNFDRTHNLIATLTYATDDNWGPKFGSIYPFGSTAFSVRSFARSGRPYTSSKDLGAVNEYRSPAEYNTDMRISKTITKFFGTKATLYFEVFNLFDNKIYNYNYIFYSENKVDGNQILPNFESYPLENITRGALYWDNYPGESDVTYPVDHSFLLYSNSPRSYNLGIAIDF